MVGVTAVPTTQPPTDNAVAALAELLDDGDVVVLSGAGLSTDSGIPDYRGATGSLRRHTPMTYQTFTRDPRGRHRYWARSFVGWRQIRAARPNAGHSAVATLQRAGVVWYWRLHAQLREYSISAFNSFRAQSACSPLQVRACFAFACTSA